MQAFRTAEHKILTANGHDFLFLVQENAIFEVEPELRTLVGKWQDQKMVTPEAVLKSLEGSQADKKELLNDLVDRHILVPADQNKSIGIMPCADRQDIPLKTLVLHVTDACNLGCLYCYYDQKDRVRKPGQTMSIEVARKAIDYLVNRSGNIAEIDLVFFGGEPLLNYGLIESAAAYARQKASELGKKVNFALTTNGTLLSDKVVAYLVEHQIGVTVSMDGNREAHDRLRRFPDGRPTYEVILPKIRRLLDHAHGKPVVARVTLANNFGDVGEILKDLLNLGFSEVGFAPVTTRDLVYQIDTNGMQRLLDQFQSIADSFLNMAADDGFLGFTNLIDLLVVLHEGEVKNYPCGAGLGLFSVDPAGDFYPCQRLVGEDPCRMGCLNLGMDHTKLTEFRNQAAIGQKKMCQKCWVRVTCAGGCYHEALIREGNLFYPNKHYCSWIKRWVEIGLETYAKLFLANRQYLDKLSMLRGHSPVWNHYI